MPRSKRLLNDNGLYHIVQRGHNKGWLFHKDSDFRTLKDILLAYKHKFDFDIYHYCIMSNHFHFILKTKKGSDLPKILQGITQTYSFYYRKTYNYTGYVYQNRYKSLVIENDAYLMECGRYVERNPLRARIVNDLSMYEWSSYMFYAYGKMDDIITRDPLYEFLGNNEPERHIRYKSYLLEARPYECLLDQVVEG